MNGAKHSHLILRCELERASEETWRTPGHSPFETVANATSSG